MSVESAGSQEFLAKQRILDLERLLDTRLTWCDDFSAVSAERLIDLSDNSSPVNLSDGVKRKLEERATSTDAPIAPGLRLPSDFQDGDDVWLRGGSDEFFEQFIVTDLDKGRFGFVIDEVIFERYLELQPIDDVDQKGVIKFVDPKFIGLVSSSDYGFYTERRETVTKPKRATLISLNIDLSNALANLGIGIVEKENFRRGVVRFFRDDRKKNN